MATWSLKGLPNGTSPAPHGWIRLGVEEFLRPGEEAADPRDRLTNSLQPRKGLLYFDQRLFINHNLLPSNILRL